MALAELSLHVVGARFENKPRRGRPTGNRLAEILMARPGDPVTLEQEPDNEADPHAVAVFAATGVQIGYLTAEKAPWISGMMRLGRPIAAIFQQATEHGAAIRVAFDGETPTLPPCATDPVVQPAAAPRPPRVLVCADPDEFYPDPEPGDDFSQVCD